MTMATKPRETVLVPVTITEMVEMPVLTEAERADLITSLQEAEASIRNGEGITYKPGDILKAYRAYRAIHIKSA